MSFHNIGIYDAHVVSYLELLKTPYTGANPRGILLSSDKGLSKKILTYHRIRVPDFAVFRKESMSRRTLEQLKCASYYRCAYTAPSPISRR